MTNKPKFRHKAVYGTTGSGKTWFMKRQAKQLIKHKQRVIVWTGTGENGWPRGAKVTDCEFTFEAMLKDPSNFGAFVMIDEGAILFELTAKRSKFPEIHRLFMAGRHKGYTVYIATQQPTTIPKKVRFNCGECICFGLGDEDSAQLVWADYNRLKIGTIPAWRKIMNLKPLHFLHFRSPNYVAEKRL